MRRSVFPSSKVLIYVIYCHLICADRKIWGMIKAAEAVLLCLSNQAALTFLRTADVHASNCSRLQWLRHVDCDTLGGHVSTLATFKSGGTDGDCGFTPSASELTWVDQKWLLSSLKSFEIFYWSLLKHVFHFFYSSWMVQQSAIASGTAVYLFRGVVLGFYSTSNGLHFGAPWRGVFHRHGPRMTTVVTTVHDAWQIWVRWALLLEPCWPRFWSMWHAQDTRLWGCELDGCKSQWHIVTGYNNHVINHN